MTERTSLNSQIDEIEDTIQTETVETSLIVEGSRVIDVAQAAGKSRLRTHMVNAGIGFFAGLFLAVVLLRAVGCRDYSSTPTGRRCCRDARSGLCQHRIELWEAMAATHARTI